MNLINNAETLIKGLKKSMFGGIETKSAEKAIREVAEEGAKQISDLSQTVSSQSARITHLSSEAEKATQELNTANARINYMREEFATQKETLAETTQKLSEAKADLSNAKAIKKGESKLADGSIQEIKINKNGTRMKKITSANGNVKSVEVEQLDGSYRKTEFDPLSGKPIQTKTNTTGKEVTVDYNTAGKSTKVSPNAEPKPELLKTTKEGNKIIKEFSDGSKAIRTQVEQGKGQIEKFDKNGKLKELYQEEITKGGSKRTLHIDYSNNSKVATQTWSSNEGYETVTKKIVSTDQFGKEFVSEFKYTTPEGELVYRPTKTDLSGNITEGKSVANYKLSEDSKPHQAKTVTTSFNIEQNDFWGSQLKRNKDVVFTKNGDVMERTYKEGDNVISKTAHTADGKKIFKTDDFVFSEFYNKEPLAAQSYININPNLDRQKLFF